MNTINNHKKPSPALASKAQVPKPVSLESIKKGAGVADSKKVASEPLRIVRAAINRVARADLLELAEKYYQRPILDLKGQPRQQSQTELIVLVVEHFGKWMNEIQMGARVLNGTPHLFGGTHWKPVTDREFEVLLGDFALRIGCDPVGFGIFTAREKLVKQFHSIHGGQPADGKLGQTLLNFRNGTLEISDVAEVMRGFEKSDLLTYLLPFDYDETAVWGMQHRYFYDRATLRCAAKFNKSVYFGFRNYFESFFDAFEKKLPRNEPCNRSG